MALLLTPSGFQFHLHEVGGLQRRRAVDAPWVQYTMWATDSDPELLTIVEASDPDECRVIVAHPNTRQFRRTVVAERLRH
jgi:hypothetical protein